VVDGSSVVVLVGVQQPLAADGTTTGEKLVAGATTAAGAAVAQGDGHGVGHGEHTCRYVVYGT
jgi:hypothetical protein